MLLALVALVCCTVSAQADVPNLASDTEAPQQLPDGYVPAPVKNFTATWLRTDDGKNNVQVSFVVPHEMISELDFTKAELTAPITTIELMRSPSNQGDYKVIATFPSPAAGEKLTWADEDVPFGMYDYMAQVYVGEAMDWAAPTTVIIGQQPAEIEEGQFTATVDPSDAYSVILTVALPTLDSAGKPLTMPITKVEFGELGPQSFEPNVFYTEDAEEVLTPGTKLQYIVEKVPDGLHLYTVQVYTATGCCAPATSQIFIGKDQPGMANNIVANVTTDGIVVSWEAPAEGKNAGDMGDPAQFTYTVKRGADQYDATAVTIAEGIKELTVTDKTQFTEENKFVYIIIVKSPYGESYPACSNELVVGPSVQLPFEEDFDVPFDEYGNTTTRYSTWSKAYSDWFCAWQVGQETYVGEEFIKPHSGAGMLYAYYNSWGQTHQWDSYTTGSIDFTQAAAPELTFWLYDIAIEGGSDVTLSIQVSDGGDFTTVQSFTIGQTAETGWRQVTVKLDALKGAERGKIRFLSQADGSNCVPVIIDDIIIHESTPDSAPTTIARVGSTAGSRIPYNLQGQPAPKNARGIVIIDGKKIMKK